MSVVAKAVFIFCAQALLAQCISSQCLRPEYGIIAESPAAWSGAPYDAPEWTAFRPSNGGGFAVTSISPMGITGISLKSENAYEGPLSVCGNIPFLGAVALEGSLPSTGSGSITYGCGNGEVAMISENIPQAPSYGYGAPLAYEAAPGYGYGYNRGCGCGAIH